MLNFVCKTLLFHFQYGSRKCTISTIATTTNFYKPIFIECISTTTTTSKEDSFTVSYLINSCGFSPKAALSASKYLHLKSRENADSVIGLLKSHGFSQTQISKAIRGYPLVLSLNPEKILLPKLEFFYSKGFSSSDLAKISCRYPNFLHRSLRNYIIPNFNCLSDLFKSSEVAVTAVKCNARILHIEGETYLAPIINVLRDIGVPDRHILYFLKRWNFPGKIDCGTFRNTVEAVKEMGINPLKSQFIMAVVAKLYGETNWESRVDIIRRWGWSEEDFLAALRRNPWFMALSKDKIMRVMDYLVNKMGIESSAIVKRPHVIGLSMEKRFIPRAAVFQFLLSKGLINRKNTNLIRMFEMPEKSFLRKFVNSYDEAPELLKLYQEKLGLLTRTKTFVSRERNAVALK